MHNYYTFTAISLVIFYICAINIADAKNLLNVDSHFNPNSVGVGDKANLAISIKNAGDDTRIESVSLKSPNWRSNLTSITPETFVLNKSLLGSNRSLLLNMEVNVNQATSGGEYIVEAVISTPFADYVVPSKLTVNRIESIPFSGNIPLSILVLVFAGIITYGIMIYVVTHKLDRGYVEMGLVSVGFGLLNWAIAYSINLVNILERIYYEPLAIAILLGISALMGIGLGYLIKGIQAFRNWRDRSKQQSSIERDFMRKGYAIDEEKAWATYVMEEWNDIKKSYGKRYSLVLRIHLKSSLNKIPFVEGILLRLEFQPPYDIILEPKYVVSCSNRRLLFGILTDMNAPILLETLKTDEKYRKKIGEYLIEKYGVTSINSKYGVMVVYNEVVTQFTNRIMTDDFFSLLDAIDFSIYGERVLRALIEKHNQKFIYEYQERVFIPGENISRVEIIKYEAFYGVALFENGRTRIIPPVYELKEHPYKKDVTAD